MKPTRRSLFAVIAGLFAGLLPKRLYWVTGGIAQPMPEGGFVLIVSRLSYPWSLSLPDGWMAEDPVNGILWSGNFVRNDDWPPYVSPALQARIEKDPLKTIEYPLLWVEC